MVDVKQILNAIDEFENVYGTSKEVVVQNLKEAFCSLFVKKNYEDTRVECNIDIDAGDIQIKLIKTIVDNDREDDLDDNIEITLEEALEENPEAKIGEDFYTDIPLDSLTKAEVIKVMSIFKQKCKESEKQAVYQAFQDKRGELITGVVEKVEPNFTIINIGRTTVNLSNNRKIGDEQFQIGEHVKVYISEISSTTGKTQLLVTRAEGGFLKRLFEEEVHEIYDGTVVIKDVARHAGERSKVSVYSTSENVDPIGACIGPGGSKIQRICAQLNKEKIDVVEYHECPGLFIAEALKPAEVIGVSVDEETHSAIAVVQNDGLRVAIGRKGINVVLAVKLTGWKIDIKELDTALGEGIVYKSIDELKREDQELVLLKRREALLRTNEEEQMNHDDEIMTLEEPVIADEEEIEEIELPVVEETKVQEEETPVHEEVVEEEKEEEIPFEEQKVEVNLTQPRISLEELENQIEQDKKKKQVQPKKKFVKKEEEKVEEVKEEKEPSYTAMPIYSDEELEEFEDEEEENSYDDDIDYSEYDEYYDDNN